MTDLDQIRIRCAEAMGWKEIDGFGGRYEVNRSGEVRSIHPISGKIIVLRQGKNVKGYSVVGLYVNKVCKTRTVGRLVAMAFVPNPNNHPEVNHINGIKADNRVGNLEWCTGSENVLHAIKLGLLTHPCGVDNPSAKLSKSDVKSIRCLLASGKSMGSLCKMFGVSIAVIFRIKHNISYQNV